jgi:hypothetical protein
VHSAQSPVAPLLPASHSLVVHRFFSLLIADLSKTAVDCGARAEMNLTFLAFLFTRPTRVQLTGTINSLRFSVLPARSLSWDGVN